MSLGMSLVFSGALRLEGIASVMRDLKSLKWTEISSKISSKFPRKASLDMGGFYRNGKRA